MKVLHLFLKVHGSKRIFKTDADKVLHPPQECFYINFNMIFTQRQENLIAFCRFVLFLKRAEKGKYLTRNCQGLIIEITKIDLEAV